MHTQKNTIRLVLADDHALTRLGIRQALEAAPDIEVVGEAENGDQAQALVAELRPDVVLLDLVMPGRRAYEVEAWVRMNCPETVALILTGHHRERFLAQAVNQGVQGYLTKEQGCDHLIDAIRRAAGGECLLTDEQIELAERWNREVWQPWYALSNRERQVLCLMARGLENSAIANHLEIGAKTVEFHSKHIFVKLGASSRAQATAWLFTYLPEEVQADGEDGPARF
ncbi:MAG: response regulator [Chloroflexota bacterium]